METLLKAQAEAVKVLNAFVSSYPKYGQSRRTSAFFEKKLDELEEWKKTFDANNIKLQPFEPISDQPYFVDGVYQQLIQIYERHKKKLSSDFSELMNESVPNLNASSFRTDANENVDDLEFGRANGNRRDDNQRSNNSNGEFNEQFDNDELLGRFNVQKAELILIFDDIERNQGSRGYLKAQLEMLRESWNDYRTISFNLQSRGSSNAIRNNHRELQMKYTIALGRLNDLLANKNSHIELPTIKIPDFNGKTTEWRSFIELFDRIVHNNESINDAVKMQYLKTSLKNEAAKLVAHIAPTADNYHSCYEILYQRYDNKREVLSKLFDSILNLNRHKSENSGDLRRLHDTVNESILAIRNLGIDTSTWDPFLNHILLHKLSKDTIKHYECQLANIRETESLKEFLTYVESRCLALQSAESKSDNNSNNSNNSSNSNYENSKEQRSIKCLFCNEEHSLMKCQKFLKKETKERSEWVKNKRVCLNCFGNHKLNDCKSKFTCKICKRKHNSILHFESSTIKANVAEVSEKIVEQSVQMNSHFVSHNNTNMLASALVSVEAKNGELMAMRVLIDQGSQASFISENALQTLKLHRHKVHTEISGIAESTTDAKHTVILKMHPRFKSDYVLTTEAIVLSKISKYSVDLSAHDFQHFSTLLLADPTFKIVSRVDIILGVAELGSIIQPGLVKSLPNEPIAQNTEFGWIISGAVSNNNNGDIKITSMISNVELDKKIKYFFEQSFPIEIANNEMPIEAFCEKHFVENFSRNSDGRYVVKMPFTDGKEKPDLGNSRKTAMAFQLQLERRFEKQPGLKDEYQKFISEYIELGHMELVPFEEKIPTEMIYYLPHHCVFKESTTTKLRVVFDASRKTDNGNSLNDELAMGAITQPDIFTIILRFRLFRFAFSADVEKMYRQIWIAKEQWNLLRILWRDDPSQPMRTYRLKTVTYGSSPAPFLAIRTLLQLAYDVAISAPRSSEIIKNYMYMDDTASGESTEEELIKTFHELKEVFASAGFNLRKWCSNSAALLKIIPDEDRELKADVSNVKTLGISWSPNSDDFSFNFNIPQNTNAATKRSLFSEIASLFDPLGWICPIVLGGKSLLQELWKQNIDWDECVPNEIAEKWNKIKSDLNVLSTLKIPRWIKFMPNHTIELHGFCDASFVGYAAVIYLKNVELNVISLVVAKAKVVPIKDDQHSNEITIPRLELSAAALLAELYHQVVSSLNIQIHRTFLWSDSQVVLAWINSNPKRFKVFVANKVIKIQKLTDKSVWSYVASAANPADCASRGMLPSDLVDHNLWWQGPEFLLTDSSSYSISNNFSTVLEIESLNAHLTTPKETVLPNVSSFYKMKRIVAYVNRFVSNCKTKSKCFDPITAYELRRAEFQIIKCIQNESCSVEIKTLVEAAESKKKSESILPLTSKFIKLSPFLKNGILRVGGRLKHAKIPFNAKHQILLPRGHFVTDLIISMYHLSSLHGGPKLTENSIRQKYWIVNSQHEIKRVLNKCIVCFRHKNATMTQIMADLPEPRINISEKAFANVAVDYTGAINYKFSKGRGGKTAKAYIAIFVCMASKAIHIELVSDLTAEACIAAFRRMVARRGNISNIYSDNGTCFVKANKDLFLLQNDDFITEFANVLAEKGTNWHFSPAGAPHFNGLAEAAVKTVKSFVSKNLANMTFTFEEISTLLAQIEATVNSRPLCSMSSDPNDLESLTPGHLLIGAPLIAPPDENFVETNSSWLSKWQQIQKMHQNFWRVFQHDYLNELQQKSKWFREKSQPKENDLVLIRDENLAPAKWPIARITKVHPGDDDRVRVVTVKMKNSYFQRPITKIAPLPIESDTKVHSHCAKIQLKKSGSNTIPIILAMLALFNFNSHAFPVNNNINSTAFGITRFQTPPGLYFEKSNSAFIVNAKWKILTFLDLKTFHDEYEMLVQNVVSLKEACKRNLVMFCDQTITRLENRLKRVNELNDVIFKKDRIQKRATLNFIGNILGDLIGVLDSRFLEQYNVDMGKLMDNSDHLMLLLKNHTSVVESTVNILKKNENEIANHDVQLSKIFEILTNSKIGNDQFQYINAASLQLNQLISDYESQQDAIIDIVSNVHHNRLDHKLFPPHQVAEQLKIISDNVINKYLVPEGHDLYKLIDLTSEITRTQIIFRISVPLFKIAEFGVYKIMSVPTVHGNELWWINKEHQYLLSSANRQLFQFMSEFELSTCNNFKSNVMACSGQREWATNAKTDNCAWNLFNQISNRNCTMSKTSLKDVWIELRGLNQWIFVLPNSIKLTIICGPIVSHELLSGEGILTLDPNCVIQTQYFQLEPKHIFSSNNSEILIPSINHSDLILSHSTDIIGFHEYVRSNFTAIEQQIEEIKKNSQLPHAKLTNVHDMHHYVMTYVIIICVIVCGFFIWRKLNSLPVQAIQSLLANRRISMPVLFARENVATTS